MTQRYHTAVAASWILLTTIFAHLLYSKMGFNPTDDGFTLAYARRLLDGQIPHRDFIIIRPALSPALHVPEVLFGGQFTYWLSRFNFFFQCACIAWLGTAFINRGLGSPLRLPDQCAFATVSFAICCHSFPAMAWHTIDGLFLCSISLRVRSVASAHARPVAYLLFGLAYLCKQSFVFVAPATLLIFRDWRDWRNVIAYALPGSLYIAILGFYGDVADSWQQLLSQRGILQVGVGSYLNKLCFCGALIGIAATILLDSETKHGRSHVATARFGAACALVVAIFLLTISSLFAGNLPAASFALFGVVCGVVLCLFFKAGHRCLHQIQIGTVAVFLAWSTSLSIGYNSPVLGSGILLVFLLGLVYARLSKHRPRWLSALSVITMLLSVIAFDHARTYHIYRDRPASELRASMSDVLPGGRFIRSNTYTHAFLYDLNRAIDEVVSKGFEYTIIPDFPGHWVKSEQKNPLPIDWVQEIELNTDTLRHRVIQSINNQRDTLMVIVQKVDASWLPSDTVNPASAKDSALRRNTIVSYVRANLKKDNETEYFDIYRIN